MVATRAVKNTRKAHVPERRISSRIKDLSTVECHENGAIAPEKQPEPETIEMTDAEIEASLRHADALEPEIRSMLIALRRQTLQSIPARAYTLPFTPEEIKSISHRKVVRQPPPYGRINKSIYLSTTLPIADLPVHKCNCCEEKAAASSTRRAVVAPEPRKKRGKAKAAEPPKEPELYCGENCHNRMLLISCSPDTCSAPDPALCTNRAFKRRQAKPVRVEYVEGPGFGLFAEETIEPGDFIIEYVGEMIDDEECERRLIKYRDEGEEHFYMLEIEKDVVIDARYRSNEARFINHSCDSNSMTQKWNVDGLRRIGIFARRRILPQEEITIDYNFSHFGDPMDCKCGSVACTGKLGLKRSDVQMKNALDKMATSKKSQELLFEIPEIKRPVLVSSLALLKSAKLETDWLHSKRRLFVGHKKKPREDEPVSSSSSSSPLSSEWSATTEEDNSSVASLPKAVRLAKTNWYESFQRGDHLREMRAVQSYVCGGKSDWTDDLLDIRPASSSTSSNRGSFSTLRAKRVSLLDARARFFTDLLAFANGSSKWNACVPSSSSIDPDRIYRFIDAMKSGQQFLNENQNDLNEDACHRCGLAGELLCCDGCPAAFHLNCTNLATVPSEGEPWFCSVCKRSARQRAQIDSSSAASGATVYTAEGSDLTRRHLRAHTHTAPTRPSLKRIFHAPSTKNMAAKRRPRKRMKTADKSYRLLEQMPLPSWDDEEDE